MQFVKLIQILMVSIRMYSFPKKIFFAFKTALSDRKKSKSSLSAAEETRARIHSNYMREMARGKFIVKSQNLTLLDTIGEGKAHSLK